MDSEDEEVEDDDDRGGGGRPVTGLKRKRDEVASDYSSGDDDAVDFKPLNKKQKVVQKEQPMIARSGVVAVEEVSTTKTKKKKGSKDKRRKQKKQGGESKESSDHDDSDDEGDVSGSKPASSTVDIAAALAQEDPIFGSSGGW